MERIDDLQYKGLRLIQDDRLFCFGMDAVLLASFAEVRERENVADLGCGSGILPVLLSAKAATASFYGFEYQPAAAALARRNAALNGLSQRFCVIEGDFRVLAPPAPIHAVVCNPPYEKLGSGAISENAAQRIARHELMCTLADAATAAARLLKTGGRLYMIHRAARAAELIAALSEKKLTPKLLRFVQATPAAPAGYVLIKCVKEAAHGLSVPPPLIIRDETGAETEELLRIYHRIPAE